MSEAMKTMRSMELSVRRAWPRDDGSLHIEVLDAGQLRAGRISASGDIELLPYRSDPKLVAFSTTGELVVHRFNRRAVVLEADRASKYVRPRKEQVIASKTASLSKVLESAGLCGASVIHKSPGRVDTALMPGQTLHTLDAKGLAGWREFTSRWPEVTTPEGLELHDASAEASVLRTWVDHVERFQALPGLSSIRLVMEEVIQQLGSSADAHRLIHRDLHDKQLLFDADSRRVSVLDVDTAARGEAALDIGNLLAHIRLREIQGVFSSATASAITELVQNMAVSMNASPERVHVYTRAAVLRLACVYAFRPSASTWLPHWLDTYVFSFKESEL